MNSFELLFEFQEIMGKSRKASKRTRKAQLSQSVTDSVILEGRESVDTRSRNWFLTWNNGGEAEFQQLLELPGLKRYAVQEETGEEGTKHLQGVLCFKDAIRFSSLKKLDKVHWEMAKNLAACKNYCTKLKTRTGNVWVKGFKVKRRPSDPMNGLTLHPWQEDIKKIIEGPVDGRKIFWYWSERGGVGKSVFTKHLYLTTGAWILGGALKDALYAIQQRVASYDWPRVIIFDIPRATPEQYVSYASIEKAKDGLFFSGKYESNWCCYDPPHVIVFANMPPDEAKLSKDRWVIKQIDAPVFNFAKQSYVL